MPDAVRYVYGIVDARFDVAGAPAGLEDAPVMLEPEGDVGALLSVLEGEAYAAESIEGRTSEVGWIGPRAMAHDRVLTWASDVGRGAVIPLPMFRMFVDATGVRAMLRERAPELARTLERVARGREYALRLYRLDARLTSALSTLSPAIAELERAAARATPGQRYLLERKIEGKRKAEARRVSASVAREVFDALAAASLAAVAIPIPATVASDAPGTLVLNAAFLVAHDTADAFRGALSAAVERHAESGFHFDFTGPWPPYHFVAESPDGE